MVTLNIILEGGCLIVINNRVFMIVPDNKLVYHTDEKFKDMGFDSTIELAVGMNIDNLFINKLDEFRMGRILLINSADEIVLDVSTPCHGCIVKVNPDIVISSMLTDAIFDLPKSKEYLDTLLKTYIRNDINRVYLESNRLVMIDLHHIAEVYRIDTICSYNRGDKAMIGRVVDISIKLDVLGFTDYYTTVKITLDVSKTGVRQYKYIEFKCELIQDIYCDHPYELLPLGYSPEKFDMAVSYMEHDN